MNVADVLTRAALLDIERGRAPRAIERAREALEAAETLDRATDIVLAHSVLARAYLETGEAEQARHHRAAIEKFDTDSIAGWAQSRVTEAR